MATNISLSPTASWRHRSLDHSDQNYADSVFRTVLNHEGKIKDQYLNIMRELKITSRDIADL
jgi:hypothetical protein